MPIAAGVIFLLVGLSLSAAAAADPVEFGALRDAWRACRSLQDAAKRLDCYDGLRSKFEPPRFEGRLNATTPLFTIDGPTLLRYQSDGAIFVLYVKDAHDQIVQNLHIGGGGESTYVIDKPGTYRLQINGIETWRIWLEPLGKEH